MASITCGIRLLITSLVPLESQGLSEFGRKIIKHQLCIEIYMDIVLVIPMNLETQ